MVLVLGGSALVCSGELVASSWLLAEGLGPGGGRRELEEWRLGGDRLILKAIKYD